MMSLYSSAKSVTAGQVLAGVGAPASPDLTSAIEEAVRLAAASTRPVSTVDVLLGVLRSGGAAARVLAERGISSTAIELHATEVRADDAIDVSALSDISRDIAAGLAAKQTTSLHLLLAVLRREGSATEASRLAGLDPVKLRGIVMRSLTGPGIACERRAAGTFAAGPLAPNPDISSPQMPGRGAQPGSTPLGQVGEDEPATLTEWRLSPLAPPQVAVLHREREVGRLLDLLQAKTARVILVVGEPGSGRSALLSALAAVSLDPPLIPEGDFGAVQSPGALLHMLHRRAPQGSPVVLDGAAWLGPEGSDGVLQLLATASAGRRWLITLTPADLRRLQVASPDLVNQGEAVLLGPPEPAIALEMIEAGLDGISAAGPVTFAPEVASCLLRLSARYPSERGQPGRAISIAEIAVARAERLSQAEIRAADVAAVVGDASGVPASQLLRNDDLRFRGLEERLAERVVGHAEARAAIASALRRSYAGFRGHRPLASFLLLGPTGVGKTETARAIAETLFDGESALVRIDLSEYSEAHSIARLIGAPPGYLAHEEGGQLTEAIRRRPASVVLLDELEKANREVLLVLLQVLEDGRLTDGRGRTVDFSAAAIVMTSNLGSECYRRARAPAASTVLALARSRLPPELWNRIDEVLCYAPLSDKELAAIVGRIARDSSRRLQAERGIAFEIEDSVTKEVLRRETDRSLGARPLRRAFERLVEGPLATEIVSGRLTRGARLRIGCRASGRLQIFDATSRPA
jgi:ATP-dependent Clp protease ATP-binding subunit ClpC